jgi:recombination protein RecA
MGRPKKDSTEVLEKNSNFDFSKIDAAISEIKKSFGEEVVINTDEIRKIPRVHLDSPILGYIMGDGGCPRGRVIELYGPESSGKSLLSQFIGSNFQRDGLFVVYVDTEHTFDSSYANIIGLKTTPDKFKLFQPDCGEDALSIAEKMAETGQVGLIIMDSVAAMTPKAELEGEMTDMQMGAQARMMGKGLRKLSGILSKSNTTIIFINQIRSGIGPYAGVTTPGGNALKFFSSIRLEVRKIETSGGSDTEDASGIKSRVKCIKNKTGIPFRKGEMDFNFKTGVDFYKEYLDFAVSLELIKKGGAWYTYGEDKFCGSKAIIEEFRTKPEYFKEIKNKIDTILSEDPSKKIDLIEEDSPNSEMTGEELAKFLVDQSLEETL